MSTYHLEWLQSDTSREGVDGIVQNLGRVSTKNQQGRIGNTCYITVSHSPKLGISNVRRRISLLVITFCYLPRSGRAKGPHSQSRPTPVSTSQKHRTRAIFKRRYRSTRSNKGQIPQSWTCTSLVGAYINGRLLAG